MSTLIFDKNKSIFLRMGTNVLSFGAMCLWNNKLVVAPRSFSSVGPNLLYFDKTVATEKGQIATGVSPDKSIASEIWSKSYGDPDHMSSLKSVVAVWIDNTTYTGSFSIYYRVHSGSVSGTSWGSWTLVGGASIALDVATETKMKEFNIASDPGYWFQFKITATSTETTGTADLFDILGFTAWFDRYTKRQVRST